MVVVLRPDDVTELDVLATARELGHVSRKLWVDLRRRLEAQRQGRTLCTRVRRNPETYLAELERKASQATLLA